MSNKYKIVIEFTLKEYEGKKYKDLAYIEEQFQKAINPARMENVQYKMEEVK